MYQKINIMDNTTLLTLFVALAVLVTFGKTIYKLLKVLLGFAAIILSFYWIFFFNSGQKPLPPDLYQQEQTDESLANDRLPSTRDYDIPLEQQKNNNLLKTIGYDAPELVTNTNDDENLLDLRNIDTRKPLDGSKNPDMTIDVHHYFHGHEELTNQVYDQSQRVSQTFIENQGTPEPIGNASYVLIGDYAKTQSEASRLAQEYRRLHLRTGYIYLPKYNKNGRNACQYGIIVARPCRSLESIQRYYDEVYEKTLKSLPSYDIVYLK
jgi:hypothetical protein